MDAAASDTVTVATDGPVAIADTTVASTTTESDERRLRTSSFGMEIASGARSPPAVADTTFPGK